MYDIVIIGAGPAGLTAALYARRASKKVLVLEANSYGGQIISVPSIENYPAEAHISGYDFATNLYNQVKELGTEIIFEKVISINNINNFKEVKTVHNVYLGKSIIIATGSDKRKIGIDREDELLGKGISYCATCDGAFFKDKEVAIYGKGCSAIKDCIYLSGIVKKVYFICPSSSIKDDTELIKKDNVEIIYNTKITKLIGKERLEGIEIGDTNNIKKILISGLFVAIGRVPENQNFANLIELDEKGYAISNEDCLTKIDGIFVAGDCRKKDLRQLVTATSDGAIAATKAIQYINGLEE